MILGKISPITEETLRFLGVKIINSSDFLDLIFRFGLNILMCYIIVHYIYKKKRDSFTFTYYSLSVLVFLLCYLLGNVKLELGFALGLFAIFGIIRYRTSLISVKDMTYLFVIIGIAVINALANKKVSWVELLFANAAIGSIMYIRGSLIRPDIMEREIRYDNVNLIHSARKDELYKDLEARLGVEIVDVKIGAINYIKDSVEITIFYRELPSSSDKLK